MIADTIQNLALLHWAWRETGVTDFREVADLHEATSLAHLVRDDDTSFHTYVFDTASGEPLRGETQQGYADDSCWSCGQAWLIHGFANCHRVTGNPVSLDAARYMAIKAESLLGEGTVPIWDYSLPADGSHPLDSSAAAVTAAGVLMLANLVPADEAAHWRNLGHQLLHGLLSECDLTNTPGALGFLTHGAAHVPAGRPDAMLPFGDCQCLSRLYSAEVLKDLLMLIHVFKYYILQLWQLLTGNSWLIRSTAIFLEPQGHLVELWNRCRTLA